MAVLDIIEYFDETGEEMVRRIPEQGSAETKYGSQLVVRENQQAVFFRDGKALDVMGPGRHTLSTQNIPLLTKLLTRLTGFGPDSPFRVEVIFVNMKVFTNLRWGTREPVAFRDAELGLVRLRAFGNYTMRVVEPQLFVNTLVGTQGKYSTSEIDSYLRDVVVARLNDLLGEQLKTIFDLPALYDELGVALKSRVADDFTKYGLEMIDFFVQSITPPEEVQKMIDERSGMGAVGDLGKFTQFQAAKSMRDAARGGGEGGEGSAASAGMGMGVGAGLGFMMPGIMGQSMKQAGQQAGQAAGQGAAGQQGQAQACPSCQAQVQPGFKFCPNCGGQMPQASACPDCGNEVQAGFKFCPNCGRNLEAKPTCPKCNNEIEPGAKFCPHCGNKME
ncbi:MAG: SPFH domain-containing protein [bacterium]